MEIKVIQLPGGQLQVFIDGEGVAFEDAAAVTRMVLTKLGAAVPGLKATSDIEGHRAGGMEHAHIVQEQGHGH